MNIFKGEDGSSESDIGKKIKGVNGKCILFVVFAISKNDKKRTIIIRQCNEGKDYYITRYVLFREQVEKLEKINIVVSDGDWHHLAQKILFRSIKRALKDNLNNKEKDQLRSLEKEIQFNLANILPYDIHQIYNKIFRNCLIPKAVLERMDLIFSERELSGNCKNSVIDLLTFIAVLTKDISSIDIEEVKKTKEKSQSIVVADFMDLLCLTKAEVREQIEILFLYPEHQELENHFDLLLKIHNKYFGKRRRNGIINL